MWIWTLLFALEAPVVNPEAMVKAAVAANDAATAAYWAAILAVLTLAGVVMMGAIILYNAFQFRELVRYTNGMREELVTTTRKLALVEGNLAGRAELQKETTDLTEKPEL